MSPAYALLATVLLLALNAFFVAAEFALTGSRRSRIEPLIESSKAARKVLWSIEHLSRMLAAAQLGVTLCSVGLGVLAEPAIAKLLEVPLHAIGLSAALTHGIAFIIALVFVVGLHVVLGEVLNGVSAIEAGEAPQAGVETIVAALNGYGEHFEHPGWTPIN